MLDYSAPQGLNADARLCTVCRYDHQHEEGMAKFKERNVAAMLPVLCEEWLSCQQATAIYAQRTQLPPLAHR